MNKTFEPGCYGDGELGHQHTRDRCADLLKSIITENTKHVGEALELIAALRADVSDDGWEEYVACDMLNDLTEGRRPDDCYWGWDDGDFGLWAAEED